MSLESWDWLIKLEESGSFTRASEELQISQQTLSSRLATLERKLDTKLMIRNNPLVLTRAGETFLKYAKEQNAAYNEMLRRLSETTIGGIGELKVGISNIRGRILMPHVLRQFHRSLPNVTVKLMEGTNEELVRMAESNEADLVIGRFDGIYPDVSVKPIFREEVVLAVLPKLLENVTGMSSELAIEAAEHDGLSVLKDCPFLLEAVSDISGRVAHIELRRAGIKPFVHVESNNMMTLLALCSEGLGAVFCPTNIMDEISNLTHNLVRIHLSEAACYQISIGTPKNAEAWGPAQVFEDIVGTLYGEHFEK